MQPLPADGHAARQGGGALVPAHATVLIVRGKVLLAAVAQHVQVAVAASGIAHGLEAPAVQALGLGERHLLAHLATLATVLSIVASVCLAAVAQDVRVAVSPPRPARVAALASYAQCRNVRQNLTHDATVTAVAGVLRNDSLASGFHWVAVFEVLGLTYLRLSGATCANQSTTINALR